MLNIICVMYSVILKTTDVINISALMQPDLKSSLQWAPSS